MRSSGKEGRVCPPLPPTYSLVGCEAEGADVGIYCVHNPTTPTIHVKLLRAVTPRESQPSTGAAADPLGRRGAVVVGPAYRPIPSRAWAGRTAWPRALAR